MTRFWNWLRLFLCPMPHAWIHETGPQERYLRCLACGGRSKGWRENSTARAVVVPMRKRA